VGFFADYEWVADVTCPDCEKSLTKGFQGTSWSPFQPAAGIELSLGKGIDVNCDNKDSGPLAGTLQKLLQNGAPRAEIDAFKLWLAFIDHGDTKTDNQKFACLDSKKDGNKRTCKPGEAVFYVSDMGSTFGYSTASEKKATLAAWKGKDPIKASGGHCTTTAKSVGDADISEGGRALLAKELQIARAEQRDKTITVFSASRNAGATTHRGVGGGICAQGEYDHQRAPFPESEDGCRAPRLACSDNGTPEACVPRYGREKSRLQKHQSPNTFWPGRFQPGLDAAGILSPSARGGDQQVCPLAGVTSFLSICH
jgi:hypothetical protein